MDDDKMPALFCLPGWSTECDYGCSSAEQTFALYIALLVFLQLDSPDLPRSTKKLLAPPKMHLYTTRDCIKQRQSIVV